MAERKQQRAIVIGGSMSGLLSGLLLRRAGWAVDLYERLGTELSGRGAGIVVHGGIGAYSSCWRLATTLKSSSVVVSPFTAPPPAISFRIRRMIFPLRVFGRPAAKRM